MKLKSSVECTQHSALSISNNQEQMGKTFENGSNDTCNDTLTNANQWMRLHFKFAGNSNAPIRIVFEQKMVMKTQVAENEKSSVTVWCHVRRA